MARKQGYLVRLSVFLTINPKDIDDPARKAQIVKDVQLGKVDGLMEHGRVLDIDYKYTSKLLEDEKQLDIEDIADDATGHVTEVLDEGQPVDTTNAPDPVPSRSRRAA
jgi:hypothetical protein